jgi:hypothetical protein
MKRIFAQVYLKTHEARPGRKNLFLKFRSLTAMQAADKRRQV